MLAIASSVLVISIVAASPLQEQAPERPNVVLLISDDQDYEHLGFMGNPLVRTPALDSLAEAGTVFTTAHVPPRCRPSLAVLLSGRHPQKSGITYNYGPGRLDPEGSLPNLLSAAGYATFFGGKFWEGDYRAIGFQHPVGRTKSFVREGQREVFDFLDRFAGEKPMFIWWAPGIPHTPHDPPRRFVKMFRGVEPPLPPWLAPELAKRYRQDERALFAMEAWLDEGVAELVDGLRSRAVLENTLFVFLIDNGYADGLISKGSPFEKGVRTPIVFSWPGRIPAGKRLDHLVESLDVFPTILDYCGVQVPASADGRSLRPLIDGHDVTWRQAIRAAVYGNRSTEGLPEHDVYALYLRTDRFKYIFYLKDVVGGPGAEDESPTLALQNPASAILTAPLDRRRGDQDLYDLRVDPYELVNLAGRAESSALLERFKTDVLSWWNETGGKPLELPPR